VNDLHVVFGSGPLGLAVLRELRRQGRRVRMVNRSGRPVHAGDTQAETVGANAADPAQARAACADAAVVFHCVGLPYPRWPEFPAIAAGIIEGAASAGARLVYGDNLYMYGPLDRPMTEDLPSAATSRKGRIRAEVARMLMDANAAGKLAVGIGRGSDFFGPFATDAAMMGSRVFARALAGKPAQLVGDPDRLHTFTFIDDFARALVLIGDREVARGHIWHVPSAPATSGREFVRMVYRALGRPARLQVAPRLVISLGGWFDPQMRELGEMLYQFERDFVMDSSRFQQAFGMAPTPLEAAVGRTLDWFRSC